MDESSIDLNADVGEGFGRWSLGDDEALLEVITSANVACGFHAGDPTIMRRVCARAAERGVAVGAQVSYRDLAGPAVFLASADAEYVTGHCLVVDGGVLVQQRSPQVEVFGLDRYPRIPGSLFS